MTTIRIHCPACHVSLRLKAVPIAGTPIRCPRCQHKFPAPELTSPLDPEPLGTLSEGTLSEGAFSSRRLPTPPTSHQSLLLWIGFGVAGIVGLMVIATVVVWLSFDSTSTRQAEARSGEPAQSDENIGRLPSLGDLQGVTSQRKPTAFYRWRGSGGFECTFEIAADLGEETRVISGVTRYRNTNIAPASFQPKDAEKPTRGSGTAFVVHPGGVLVTCAHVVKNATSISVAVDGRPLRAQVIARDVRNDIALLRISATQLPCLPLANSDRIQLAEEVRAFGYPLTSLLGESIKISRGEVSGIVQQTGRKLIQIDATVNPGNSGGPVVDAQGRVVAIASALIAGDDIAAIGFAIPANVARRLLEQTGVILPQASVQQTLSGPEVARKVSPSVMLVNVEFGGDGSAGQQNVVEYAGSFKSQREKNGFRTLIASTVRGGGRLLIDQFGRISHSVGETDLPMLQGQLGRFGIEPLSADGLKTWQESQVASIVKVVRSPTTPRRYRSPLERLYGRSPYGFGGSSEQKVEIQPIVEQVDYEVIKENSDIVEIKKTYHLETMQEAGEPTRLVVAGTGTLVFDKRAGMPRSMRYQGTFALADGDQTVRVPITIVCQYKKLEDTETARANRPPARRITTPSTPRKTAPRPPRTTRGKQSGGLDKFDPTK